MLRTLITICLALMLTSAILAQPNTWAQLDDMPATAGALNTTFTIGTKTYVCLGVIGQSGSNEVWEFDATTHIWTAKTSFPGGSRSGAVGFTVNGKGYVGLGTYASTFFQDFWEYDPAMDTWTQMTDFPFGPRAYAASFAIGQYGYVGTGQHWTGSSVVLRQDLWRYDPATNSWASMAPWPLGPSRGNVRVLSERA